jgi:hypothetical protein
MPDAQVREPRTISGRAWVSGLRPHLRRAVGATIVAIEDEAAAPYAEAVREARDMIGELVALGAPPEVAQRARRVEGRLSQLIGE